MDLALFGGLALAGLIATIIDLARDGYRPTPTQPPSRRR